MIHLQYEGTDPKTFNIRPNSHFIVRLAVLVESVLPQQMGHICDDEAGFRSLPQSALTFAPRSFSRPNLTSTISFTT
jgi:hypothetical protein